MIIADFLHLDPQHFAETLRGKGIPSLTCRSQSGLTEVCTRSPPLGSPALVEELQRIGRQATRLSNRQSVGGVRSVRFSRRSGGGGRGRLMGCKQSGGGFGGNRRSAA